jgi:selenocysteine-specific elongation factor
MHIIGTAGHVDHGKSALVIALTGHDPDRFIEERERGMTLDLGFAPLRFDDGVEAGIIDVPGHERFLHNMLAGAAGMELLLLVVDATEGPRRQTFDHLHILDFLNVQRTIIVLTKRDLVDDEGLAIAAELARDAVKETRAEDAPVIAVSNVTGKGIAELKAAIHEALAVLPPRDPDAPAYLPVDRVFALTGLGTILTGTLMQGTIRIGDTLTLQPSGLEARVRSLQTFGRSADAVSGGARVAVNVPGIDAHAIGRGEALVASREFTPVSELQVDFTPLPAALRLLKRRMPVRAHIGSAEIPGTLVFEAKPPGDAVTTPARLLLTRPTVFYPGSRLIVRRMSPKDLLGGAIARATAGAPADASLDPHDGKDSQLERVLSIVQAAGPHALETRAVAAAANIIVAAAQAALDQLAADGRVIALHKPSAYVSDAEFDAAFDRLKQALAARHRDKPWSLGMTAREAASALEMDETQALRFLTAWHDDGRLSQTGRLWHLPDVAPELTPQQRSFLAEALRADPATPLVPHSFDDINRRAGSSGVPGMLEAIDTLLVTGGLIRVGDDLYRRAQIERAHGLLVALLQDGSSATMAQLRDAFGTSRKHALPLMEHFDGTGLTVRDGDLRRLRKVARPAAT